MMTMQDCVCEIVGRHTSVSRQCLVVFVGQEATQESVGSAEREQRRERDGCRGPEETSHKADQHQRAASRRL